MAVAGAWGASCCVSSAQDLKIYCVWSGGGTGTCTVVKGPGPNGKVVLLDETGTIDQANALCDDILHPNGIHYIDHIDYAIACHYDGDHIDGLNTIVPRMGGIGSFGVFYDRGGTLQDDGRPISGNYLNLVGLSGRRATPVLGSSGDIDLGNGAVIRFLSMGAPNDDNAVYIRGRTTPVTTGVTENNKSISVLVTYGGFDFYFGSDLERTGEEAIASVITQGLGRDVDVLHVDHHGSNTNDTNLLSFFQAMDPEVAVISVGNNGYGHPRRTTVESLEQVVEPLPQRIIRLAPGNITDPSCAPENMPYCTTTNSHLAITTNGATYTVSIVPRSGGNDITEPGLTDHPVDEPTDIWVPPAEIIVIDNTDPGFEVNGMWDRRSAGLDKYGSDYRYHAVQNADPGSVDTANWSADVIPGWYEVSVWYPAGSNRSQFAQYIVHDSIAGPDTFRINQQLNGGKWNKLGPPGTRFHFGGNALIDLTVRGTEEHPETGKYVIADAVKLSLVERDSPSIIIDNEAANPHNAEGAQFSIVSDDGHWSTGTACGAQKYGDNYHYHDNSAASVTRASWTVPVPPGRYYVYIRYTSCNENRTTAAQYIVHDDAREINGILINQTEHGGQWIALGAYEFGKGVATIDLGVNGTGGYVIADAVGLNAIELDDPRYPLDDASRCTFTGAWSSGNSTPGGYPVPASGSPNSVYRYHAVNPTSSDKAIWSFTGLPSGSYRAAVWYTATGPAGNRSHDAHYLVSGGSKGNLIDQAINGGSWRPLTGAFHFDQNATVTLDVTGSDSSKYVVADAVGLYLIP